MAENLTQIIGIELLAGCQGCDFHAPLASSAPVERVRALLRARVPHLDDDRYLAPDIAAAADLVRSGAVARRRVSRCRRCGGDGIAHPGISHQRDPGSGHGAHADCNSGSRLSDMSESGMTERS